MIKKLENIAKMAISEKMQQMIFLLRDASIEAPKTDSAEFHLYAEIVRDVFQSKQIFSRDKMRFAEAINHWGIPVF